MRVSENVLDKKLDEEKKMSDLYLKNRDLALEGDDIRLLDRKLVIISAILASVAESAVLTSIDVANSEMDKENKAKFIGIVEYAFARALETINKLKESYFE